MKPIKGGKDHTEKGERTENNLQPAGLEGGKEFADKLMELVSPYLDESADENDLEAALDLGILAWNLGSMRKRSPETFKAMMEEVQLDMEEEKDRLDLVKKLLKEREQKFGRDLEFLEPFTVEEGAQGAYVSIKPISFEEFVREDESADDEFAAMEGFQDDWNEGFINRCAVLLKPRQPYINWVNEQLKEKESIQEFAEHTVYLVPAGKEIGEVQSWIERNFARLFEAELDTWADEKTWPQARDYSVFKTWFTVEINTMVYDLEATPLRKEI